MKYKLVTFLKNGKVKNEYYSYKDLNKAYRKLTRSSKLCELWYVLDGVDHRLVVRNYPEGYDYE